MNSTTFSIVLLFALTATFFPQTTSADIYEWQYINPADPSQGREQSATLCPDGLGAVAEQYADLSSLNLTQAWLYNSYLRSANLENTILTNADLTHTDLYLATLINTNLTNTNLSHADFGQTSLDNADFTDANLRFADFIGSELNNINFTNANLTAAFFSDLDYFHHNPATLTNINFTNANLTDAVFIENTLTNVDFTDSIVIRTGFIDVTSTGFTKEHLYSTASYKSQDLHDIILCDNDLTNWNFANQNLTNASFRYTTLTNADFTNAKLTNVDFFSASLINANLINADLREASDVDHSQTTLKQNMIYPGAHVEGFILTADQSMRLWDYNNTYHPELMNILIEDELTLDPISTLTMIFEDDHWGSTLIFDTAIPVTLAGTLELLLDPTLDPASLLGTTFDLFDFSNITLTTTFDYLATSPNLTWDTSLLYTTGQVTLTAIPEPTTLTLITLTSLAALNPRRKQRKA